MSNESSAKREIKSFRVRKAPEGIALFALNCGLEVVFFILFFIDLAVLGDVYV